MSILHKPQFCNGYVKSSKLDSFLKRTKSLLTVVMQISTVNRVIFVYYNASESMTIYLSKFNVQGKVSRNTHLRKMI